MCVLFLQEGKLEAEDFTSRLYRELNSSPQPYLVPFLKVRLSGSGTSWSWIWDQVEGGGCVMLLKQLVALSVKTNWSYQVSWVPWTSVWLVFLFLRTDCFPMGLCTLRTFFNIGTQFYKIMFVLRKIKHYDWGQLRLHDCNFTAIYCNSCLEEKLEICNYCFKHYIHSLSIPSINRS